MLLSDFASIVLYVVVLSGSALLMYLGNKTGRRSLIALSLLLPVLLAGVRYMVGTDYEAYDKLYGLVQTEDSRITLSRLTGFEMEPFIIGVSILGGWLSFGSWFLFGIYALITTLFAYFAFRLVDRRYCWVLFGSFLFVVFLGSFNQMRQIAAIAVLAYLVMRIIKNMTEKKHTKVMSIVLGMAFATMLHYSSIMLAPVLLVPYIVSKIKHRRTLYLFCCLGIAGLTVLLPRIIDLVVSSGILPFKQVQALVGGNFDGSILNFGFFAFTTLFAIAVCYFRPKPNDKQDDVYAALLGVGAMYAALGFYSGYLGRLADLFWMVLLIVIWKVLGKFSDSIRLKILLMTIFSLLYFLVVYVVIGAGEVLPYQTIGGGNV